jgi:hypothetical protein
MVKADVDNIIMAVSEAVDAALTDTPSAGEEHLILDTPSLFFVSTKLAGKFDHLLESAIVLSFHSYFPPGRLTSSWRDSRSPHPLGLIDSDAFSKRVRKGHKPAASDMLQTFVTRFSSVVLFMWLLRGIGAVSTKFQVIAVHCMQPVIIAILFFGCNLIVNQPAYIVVVVVFLVYECWRFYRLTHPNKVLPTQEEEDASTRAPQGVSAKEDMSGSTRDGKAQDSSQWRHASRLVRVPGDADGVNYWEEEEDEDEEATGKSTTPLRVIGDEAKQDAEVGYWSDEEEQEQGVRLIGEDAGGHWEEESDGGQGGAEWVARYQDQHPAPLLLPVAEEDITPAPQTVETAPTGASWASGSWAMVDGAYDDDIMVTHTRSCTVSSDARDDIHSNGLFAPKREGEEERGPRAAWREEVAHEEVEEEVPGPATVLLEWLIQRSNLAELVQDPCVQECLNEPADEGYWEVDNLPEYASLWS